MYVNLNIYLLALRCAGNVDFTMNTGKFNKAQIYKNYNFKN